MIKFGILTCDNCRKILATGASMLEQEPAVVTLESGYDVSERLTGEGVHVCSDRCKRGEYYNKSKHAKQLMHKHFYGSSENQ